MFSFRAICGGGVIATICYRALQFAFERIIPQGQHMIAGYSKGNYLEHRFRQWMEAPWADNEVLGRVAIFSIIGYEAKDFIAQPGGLSGGLIIHHTLALGGCVLFLMCPVGAGLIVMSGCVAEIGSVSFNLYTLGGGGAFYAWLFFWLMLISNVGVLWLGVEFFYLEAGGFWRELYLAITVCLVVIRFIGVYLAFEETFFVERKKK